MSFVLRVWPTDPAEDAQHLNDYMWEHMEDEHFRPADDERVVEAGKFRLTADGWVRFLLVAILGGLCPEHGMKKFDCASAHPCPGNPRTRDSASVCLSGVAV